LRATAALQPTKGSKATGEATFEQVGDQVHVSVLAQGLKPGQAHAFRILEAGDCGASTVHRAGDLPALQAGKDGHAQLEADLSGVTIAPGPNSIIGHGLIIDAHPDDHQAQPTGNSGARIACGVIKAG
jgi:Cu-Zn family superoxide dismutase